MERIHKPSKTFHAIDFISSPILFPYFNFSVSNNLHRNYHFPLFLSFHDFNSNSHKNSRYNYDRADRLTYTLNTVITPAMTEGDTDGAVAMITQNY